jgi:hypothetical protein
MSQHGQQNCVQSKQIVVMANDFHRVFILNSVSKARAMGYLVAALSLYDSPVPGCKELFSAQISKNT